MSTEFDFLSEDVVRVNGQNFALISVVSPSSTQQFSLTALKIRGVFSTEEEAKKHAEKLMKMDPSFDVFLVETHKWLQIPPNVDEIENQVFQDKRLNDLIRGYHEEQMKSKEHFEARKQEEIEEAIKILQKERSKAIEAQLETDDNGGEIDTPSPQSVNEEVLEIRPPDDE